MRGCGENHDFVIDADNPYNSRFLYGVEEGDVWILVANQTCVECFESQTVDLQGTETLKDHVFSYARDLGHGVDEHFHEYRCAVCGRTETRSFICNGPPCMAIVTKKPDEEETEQVTPVEMEVE